MESSTRLDRADSPPFLLKLFYRTGAFHRPDEFASRSLPPFVPVYTWPTCTLSELAHHLASASPAVLPDPAIGTRLVFRLVFADTRGGPNQPVRYVPKDLGSVVIGNGGPGATNISSTIGTIGSGVDGGDHVIDGELLLPDGSPDNRPSQAEATDDADKTLAEAKFVVGDYISCAILPPVPGTGEVAAADTAYTGRRAGVGETRSSMGVEPPPRRDNALSRGFGRIGRGGAGAGGMGGHGEGAGRFRDRGRRYADRDRAGPRERPTADGLPEGEWRRGESLPESADRPRARMRR